MREKIVLYTIGCPKCNILEKKLKEKQIECAVNTSEADMRSLKITSLPILSISADDPAGFKVTKLLDFGEAVEWINNYNKGDTK